MNGQQIVIKKNYFFEIHMQHEFDIILKNNVWCVYTKQSFYYGYAVASADANIRKRHFQNAFPSFCRILIIPCIIAYLDYFFYKYYSFVVRMIYNVPADV